MDFRPSECRVHEVISAMAQGFVDKPSDCDISAVLGMGFPAWRGGPLKHGDAVGAKTVLSKLQACCVANPFPIVCLCACPRARADLLLSRWRCELLHSSSAS